MNKEKLECFGTANMSDACAQCPDNKLCSEETIRRWKELKTKMKLHNFCFGTEWTEQCLGCPEGIECQKKRMKKK